MHTTKRKQSNSLPKMSTEIANGGIFEQSIRCGKPNCRCANGDMHRGYYYFIFRTVQGRLRKRYVPKSMVTMLQNLVAESRTERRREREIRQMSSRLLTQFHSQLKEILGDNDAASED